MQSCTPAPLDVHSGLWSAALPGSMLIPCLQHAKAERQLAAWHENFVTIILSVPQALAAERESIANQKLFALNKARALFRLQARETRLSRFRAILFSADHFVSTFDEEESSCRALFSLLLESHSKLLQHYFWPVVVLMHSNEPLLQSCILHSRHFQR